MPLESLTESNHWRLTETLYDRVKKQQQSRGSNVDADLKGLLSDLGNYMQWQRYAAGRRNHKWDENVRHMNRDRDGYTDGEMIRDFKKLKPEDHRCPTSPIPLSLVIGADIAYAECQIRQLEVDELEIYLQHKLGELENAHDIFRDSMCEIKRQSFHVRSNVRARPVNFPAWNWKSHGGSRPNAAERAVVEDLKASQRMRDLSAGENQSLHTSPSPIPQDVLTLYRERYKKDSDNNSPQKSWKKWKQRWSSFKKKFLPNNN